MGSIQFEDTPEFREMALEWYPESENDGLKRAEKGLEKQHKLYRKQSETLSCHIIVSHGFFVDAFSPYKFCDYCAITAYKLFQNGENAVKEQFFLISSAAHITTK